MKRAPGNLTLFVDRHQRVSDSCLRLAEKAVLWSSLKWVDREGVLWPSMASWARAAGVSRRAFQAALSRLKAAGIIETTRASKGGRAKTSRYRVGFESIPMENTVQKLHGKEPVNCAESVRNCADSACKPCNICTRTVLGTGLRTDSLRGRLQTLGVTGDTLDELAADPHLTPEVLDAARANIRRPSAAALVAAIRQRLGASPTTGQEGSR